MTESVNRRPVAVPNSNRKWSGMNRDRKQREKPPKRAESHRKCKFLSSFSCLLSLQRTNQRRRCRRLLQTALLARDHCARRRRVVGSFCPIPAESAGQNLTKAHSAGSTAAPCLENTLQIFQSVNTGDEPASRVRIHGTSLAIGSETTEAPIGASPNGARWFQEIDQLLTRCRCQPSRRRFRRWCTRRRCLTCRRRPQVPRWRGIR